MAIVTAATRAAVRSRPITSSGNANLDIRALPICFTVASGCGGVDCRAATLERTVRARTPKTTTETTQLIAPEGETIDCEGDSAAPVSKMGKAMRNATAPM